MTLDLDAIKARLERGEATCAKCGAPRGNHPYRHMFQPSHDDGLATFVPALVAEVERMREALARSARLRTQYRAALEAERMHSNPARAALKGTDND